jgi:ABC-type Na+ transport system ATPase subunit NatA
MEVARTVIFEPKVALFDKPAIGLAVTWGAERPRGCDNG